MILSSSLILEGQEELRDKLLDMSEHIEGLVIDLGSKDEYEHSVKELFRFFHTLKALSGYLGCNDMHRNVAVIEDVLGVLRLKKRPVRQEMIDWFLQLSDFVVRWAKQAEEGNFDFEKIDDYTINIVKTSAVFTKRPEELLKELKVMHLCNKPEDIEYSNKNIRRRVGELIFANGYDSFMETLKEKDVDIMMVSADMPKEYPSQMIKECKSMGYLIPTILMYDGQLPDEEFAIKKRLGVDSVISGYKKSDALLQNLVYLARVYYEDKSIKLTISPVFKKISTLKPLPQTMIEIDKIKDDPETTAKELTAIISKDPMVTAKCLRYANSPTFGLKGNISSLHQAISLLGTEKVCALAMQYGIESSMTVDVSPYKVSNDDFFKISFLRMNFMMSWYPRINLSKTATMVTAALLGNIGQVMIADDVKRQGAQSKFYSIISSTDSPEFAEMEFCNTTTQDVTADMLSHWGLDEELVLALRYSYDFVSAPDETKPLSIALYALFQVIPSHKVAIDEKKATDMASFLSEMNFNPDYFYGALVKTKELME